MGSGSEGLLPDVPVIAISAGRVHIMTADGELKELPPGISGMALHGHTAMVCHAPFTRSRLGTDDLLAFDLLELFAFVHPGRFCVPTPYGLAKSLGVDSDEVRAEDLPLLLADCAVAMLEDLGGQKKPDKILEVAAVMGLQGKGWPWTPYVFNALGATYDPKAAVFGKNALNVWRALPEWSEDPPEPQPSHYPVSGTEAREKLDKLLGPGAESRPQQAEYAATVASAFSPLDDQDDSPHVVLAEAGTGVGKTLGYLAPAGIWAEKNGGAVWISTFTKNLQRQIERESDRLYPDPQLKERHVAVRKGRENYLCLLNFEDLAAGAALAKHPSQAVAAGLMARWIEVTGDGDLSGGDFPGWLPGLLGRAHTSSLCDRRGECIYGACDHYHRCFVERSIRKAAHASIVVANHALAMVLTADAGEDSNLPKRYVFDEGHHLFDAADSAFAGHLSARETRDMRRWLLGGEGGRKSRARGLQRRVEDIVSGDDRAMDDLHAIQTAARDLTGDGWSKRLKSGLPSGPAEKFMYAVYGQVFARADGRDGPYSLETPTFPLAEGVTEAASELKRSLNRLYVPMQSLGKRLRDKLADDKGEMSSDTRTRMESAARSLGLRQLTVSAWVSMLQTLEEAELLEEFIDWLEIERIDGNAVDVGMYRHHIDPMRPFAASIKSHAHGIVFTSATMRDASGDEEADWAAARDRTGADYLTHEPVYLAENSPFDYAASSRVFIITDVNKHDQSQVSGACAALFEASGGGALGLFTSIQRLREVHGRISPRMEQGGMSLYSQHVDGINTGTLVDIFREDTHSCLLGTDAVRDGIDVPGASMRLLVYDRVPWPRPTILHRARRVRFGGRRYDEMITRLKLRQAFGRLIRSRGDRGVFVMLDSMLPSRLLGAFPEGAPVQRLGLGDAVRSIREFLG